MSRLIDLTGQHFSNLTVLKRAENNKEGRAMWLCQCECGNIKIANGHYLRSGKINSCGCISSKNNAKIDRLLTQNNISFIKEYKFNDLKDKNKLSFDFFCK